MAVINKRSLTLRVGTIEYANIASSAKITSGEKETDYVTFAEANTGGGRQYTLELTIAQDAAAGTAWRNIFDNAGVAAACIFRPYGNATATPAQPHFTFSAVIKEPDGVYLGGDADASTTAVQTVDLAWSIEAKPVLITA